MPSQSATDTFSWAGGSAGNWNQPSDWFDITTGNAGTIVPDGSSTVIVTTGAAVSATGAAGTLDLTGSLGLSGAFNFGTVVEGNGGYLILTGPTSGPATVSISDLIQTGTATALTAVDSNMTVVVDNLGTVTGTLSSQGLAMMILPDNVTVAGGTLITGGLSSDMIIGNPGTGLGTISALNAFMHVEAGATLSGYGSIYGNMDYSPGSGSLPGQLLYDGFGLAVDGLVRSSGFTVYGALAGSGTVDVLDNGYFTAAVTNAVPNNVTFNIGSNATLHVSSNPDFAQQINFAGTGGIAAFYEDDYKELFNGLPLAPNIYLSEAAPISGFTQGDRLFAAIDPGSALLAPVWSSALGALAFNDASNPGITAAYFVMTGSVPASDILATTVPDYLTTGAGAIDFQVDMRPSVTYALSAGSGQGDTFTWAGLSAGAWGDAANWFDATKGAAATVAPGAGDTAIINGGSGAVYMVVTQAGSVGTLVDQGHVALEGTFAAGTIETASGGTLLVTNGGMLTGAALDLASGSLLQADGNSPGGAAGTVAVSGTVTLAAGGAIAAAAGGRIDAGGLVTQGGAGTTNSLQIDPGGAMTVGTLDDAAANELRIDPGAVFTDESPSSSQFRLAGTLNDLGTLIASNIWVNTLLGDGTIDVVPGGVLAVVNNLQQDVTFNAGPGGAVTVDSGSPVAPIGGTYNLSGSNDSLYFSVNGSLGGLFMPATLNGFGSGDSTEIELNLYPQYVLNPIVAADFIATGPNQGIVSFTDSNGAQVGSIAAIGPYGPDALVVTRNDPSNYNVNVTPAEQGFVAPGSVDASGGTFSFTGPSGGNWADPANWTQSGGTHPAAPPGGTDTVTMGAGSNGLTVLTGSGAAQTWLLDSYTPAVAGDVTIGTLVAGTGVSDSATYQVFVDHGSTLAVNTLTENGFYDSLFVANEPGAVLSIGTLSGEVFYGAEFVSSAAGIVVANGGSASVGNVSLSVLLGGLGGGLGSGAFPFLLEGDGTLTLPASIVPGGLSGTLAISMSGTGNLLAFDSPAAAGLNEQVPIGGFADTDVVDVTFGAGNPAVVFTQNGTLSETATFENAASQSLGALVFSGNFTGHTFYATALGPNETQIRLDTPAPLCFLRGTMIATPSGEREVERLAAGDHVLTAGGAARPIVWIGQGRMLTTRGHRTAATPVIVRKGALAPDLPTCDLHITKAHALFLDEALIPVEFLVNHRSILWDDHAQAVELYHVELDTHDVLLANGAPAESYRADGNRWLFSNSNSGWHLPPKPPCAPVVTGGARVDAVWRRLLDRAGCSPRLPLTDDPDLHLLADGRRIEAHDRAAGSLVFRLPKCPAALRIASRSGVPQELGLNRDPRELGVALRRIVVRHGRDFRIVDAADDRLVSGFHPFEAGTGVRWTDGDATMPAELLDGFAGALELVLTTAGATRYIDDGEPVTAPSAAMPSVALPSAATTLAPAA